MIRMKDGAERSKVCNWEIALIGVSLVSGSKSEQGVSVWDQNRVPSTIHQPRLPVRNHTIVRDGTRPQSIDMMTHLCMAGTGVEIPFFGTDNYLISTRHPRTTSFNMSTERRLARCLGQSPVRTPPYAQPVDGRTDYSLSSGKAVQSATTGRTDWARS